MLNSKLTLVAASGRFDDLVAEYRARGVIEAALPFGLLRGEAVRPASAPTTLVVTSLWAGEEDYDSWLASDERVRVTTGIWSLLEPGVEPVVEKFPVPASAEPREAAVVLSLSVDAGPVERLIVVVRADDGTGRYRGD